MRGLTACRGRACPLLICVLVLAGGNAAAAGEAGGETAPGANPPAAPDPDAPDVGTDPKTLPGPDPGLQSAAASPDSPSVPDSDVRGAELPPDAGARAPGSAAAGYRASLRSVLPAVTPMKKAAPLAPADDKSESGATRPQNPKHAGGVPAPDELVPEPDRSGAPGGWGELAILKSKVQPGQRRDLQWTAGQSFAGTAVKSPVAVIRGANAGPTLCLTAAIHGDELNGVEIVRRTLAGIDADELSGTLIGVPIVNMLGFSRGSRYLPDRRDLNRYFPGRPEGSSASRIAHLFYSSVMRHCDFLVDFHTGSFKRTNLPQLRADLGNEAVREFVGHFGATAVLHKRGARGTLRRAATDGGIPAVTFELGEPATLQLRYVGVGVKTIETLLDKLGMLPRFRLWMEPQPVFYRSHWLRAYRGGILTSGASVGKWVREGELLGTVVNPLTNEHSEIRSPYDGRLLGRALNQFVLPGFATFHIGIETKASAPVDVAEALESGLTGADDGDPGDDEIATAEPVYPDDPRLPQRLDDELQDDELH